MEKLGEIIIGIANIFFGIFIIWISYNMLGKPYCDGGTIGLFFPILFGTTGIAFMMVGIYRIILTLKEK